VSPAVVRSLVLTELRLHRRHGVLLATGVMTAVWITVLLALAPAWRADAVRWVLFLELATLGFFVAPALVVVERSNGVTHALRLTRLAPSAALAVRIAMLAAAVLVAASAVVPVAGRGWPPDVLVGAVLTSLLVSLLAVVMIGRATTLTAYVARVPAVAVPLVAPALLHGTGLVEHPWLALSPLTGALDLLGGRWSWSTVAWILICVTGLWIAAVRIGFDVAPGRSTGGSAGRSGAWPAAGATYRPWSAVRSLARADRHTILADRLLLLVLAGVPVLALAVRWLSRGGLVRVEGRYGLDLVEHLPVVWALVLVVHTPVMLGAIAGLLFLEDRDAGLLPVLATTRASLSTLLTYRLGATAAGTAVLVVAAVPLAGAHHPAGTVGVVATGLAAGAVATVPAMVLATLARDRVQGMALTKAMGLPLYLPLAWWFVDGPAGWLFLLAPTAWTAKTFWADSAITAVAFALGGITVSALLAAALAVRLRRSVVA
jgi:fluoroquinolone transport system permease protein